MQTLVKKWFRDKEFGFLENGSGPDIMVRKTDLIKCQFLKIGATVEFECHLSTQGLIAKNVRLVWADRSLGQKNGNRGMKEFRPGVMT